MAQATQAMGTVLKVGSGSPLTYSAIALVSSIDGPNWSAETIDVTNHNNVDGYREFISGLKDSGEIKFDLFLDLDDTSHTGTGGVYNLFNTNALSNWKLDFTTHSPAKAFTFKGVITDVSHSFPVDGAKTASVTIKISGATTLA